jgi:hypothetical protein
MGTDRKAAAAEAAKAVRAATIDLGTRQSAVMRRKLHYGCWQELPWRTSQWQQFETFFNNNAALYGSRILRHLHDGVRQRLAGLTHETQEPFLVVRGVFSRRYPAGSLIGVLETAQDEPSRKVVREKAEALIFKRRFNLIAATLISATGHELRKKLEDDKAVYYDFITTTNAEKTPFLNDPDMYLRFRTANPAGNLASHIDKSARIILYACLENPIADPVYLIRVEDVVLQLAEEQRALLSEPSYCFFDYWDTENLVHVRAKEAKSILHKAPDGGYWLSFDPQSFNPDYPHTTSEQLAAVAALMDAIRKCGANPREIVLRRGDALVVDNYRALTRRRERPHRYFDFRPLGRSPLRWLRVYRGYSKN